MFACKEIGRLPPVFADASVVAQTILDSGYEYDNGSMFFNTFKCVNCRRASDRSSVMEGF